MKKKRKAKVHNTPEYRSQKRITAFVSPELKAKILLEAKKYNHSVSKESGAALMAYYFG